MVQFDNLRRDLALTFNRRLFFDWPMLMVGALAIFANGPGRSFIFSVFVTDLSGGCVAKNRAK